MEFQALNVELLDDTLRNWDNSQELAKELRNLKVLEQEQTRESSVLEVNNRFYDYVLSIVLENLQKSRRFSNLVISEEHQGIGTAISADFQVGNSELEAWSSLYYRYLAPAHLSVADLAKAASIGTRQFRRRVLSGLDYLLKVIQKNELELVKQQRKRDLYNYLPAAEYAQLFGVTALLKQIKQLLLDTKGPRFISVEGLGGLGKTSLAQATAASLAENNYFAGILWVSARQEWLTDQGKLEKIADQSHSLADVVTRLLKQLEQTHLTGLSTEKKLNQLKLLLSANPYLVIIDNLETLADSQLLLPTLYPFAGQTRFLFTSRHTLRHYPYIYVVPLPELSLVDSTALVNTELKRRGRQENLSAEAMQALYQTIGGLPLALKLAVAQIGRLPLKEILNGIKQAQQAPEKLYTYIYYQTWQLLNDVARQLLLSLLFISPDGEDISWIRSMSNLPPVDFDVALNQLVDYCLLETSGTLENPLYHLHRLTITFLQTEILLTW